MSIRTQLSSILASPEKLAAAAGVAVSDPNKVAMNAAGLIAVVTSAGILAELEFTKDDEGYVDALRFLAAIPEDPATLGGYHRALYETAKRVAQATWMSCQIYRAMVESPETPYARLARPAEDGDPLVRVYDLLPAAQVAKDWKQISQYAAWLLTELNLA